MYILKYSAQNQFAQNSGVALTCPVLSCSFPLLSLIKKGGGGSVNPPFTNMGGRR